MTPRGKYRIFTGKTPDGTLNAPDRVLDNHEMSQIRDFVYHRDQGRCVLCGKRPIEIHEIEYRSKAIKNSSKIFRPDNMICLCIDCHRRWHEDSQFRKKQIGRVGRLIDTAP